MPNTERRFRIDMTAQVYIIINQAKDALLIPSAALQPAGKTGNSKNVSTKNTVTNADSDSGTTMANVRVLKADGTVVEQAVTVGINNRVNAEILSGLKKGDEVILSEEEPDSGSKGGGGKGGRPF